jgi:hypothetical protein
VLKFLERRLGLDLGRADPEHEPNRAGASGAVLVVIANCFYSERRRGPPATVATVERHAKRVPTNIGMQPRNLGSPRWPARVRIRRHRHGRSPTAHRTARILATARAFDSPLTRGTMLTTTGDSRAGAW